MYMCLYITKCCFTTSVICEMWPRASQDLFCSRQPFQHPWWCRGAVDLGAPGVICWVCWAQATSQEMSVRPGLLQAAACSASQPPPAQGHGALVLGGRKGKSVVSPACKGHSVCVAVSTARLHFRRALLLISSSGDAGEAREAGGVLPLNLLLLLLPRTLLPVVPAVLPAAGHPCPCMGLPCCPFLASPLHGPSMVCPLPCPSWLLLLLKASCAQAPHRGCCFGVL